MKRTQIMSSGLAIRQDFGEAVRAVFFQTDYEEFLYATDGGTLFLIRFRDRLYGLTCAHVFQGFQKGSLFVTQDKWGKKGTPPAPIKGICYPSSPRDTAVGTDIIDMCAIEFSDDIVPDFFGDTPYILDSSTVATSQIGHELHVVGVLKDKSQIVSADIAMGFCRLQLRDAGAAKFDPVLRHATAVFAGPKFERVTGISGAPVFDRTANALCGMVVRGGMNGHKCDIYFIDIFDIVHFLEGVNQRVSSTYYTKQVIQHVPAKAHIKVVDDTH